MQREIFKNIFEKSNIFNPVTVNSAYKMNDQK